RRNEVVLAEVVVRAPPAPVIALLLLLHHLVLRELWRQFGAHLRHGPLRVNAATSRARSGPGSAIRGRRFSGAVPRPCSAGAAERRGSRCRTASTFSKPGRIRVPRSSLSPGAARRDRASA